VEVWLLCVCVWCCVSTIVCSFVDGLVYFHWTHLCRYIADVLCEFRNSKMAKEGWQSRLLFKKRMFRETDESITEPQFVNLSYVQVCVSLSLSL